MEPVVGNRMGSNPILLNFLCGSWNDFFTTLGDCSYSILIWKEETMGISNAIR